MAENKKLSSTWEDVDVSGMSDVRVVIVEGKEFNVSAHLLAMHSPYFHSLFFGSFKEASEKKIVLNEIDVATFTALLNIIYPCGHALTSSKSALSLLDIAYKFDIPHILELCHKTLLGPHPEKANVQDDAWRWVFNNQHNNYMNVPSYSWAAAFHELTLAYEGRTSASRCPLMHAKFAALSICYGHGDLDACTKYANCLSANYQSFMAEYSIFSQKISSDLKGWLLDFIAKKFPKMICANCQLMYPSFMPPNFPI